ncbi:hypothetical protein LEMLEM_LOCUS19316 [Lemmus lemmus]
MYQSALPDEFTEAVVPSTNQTSSQFQLEWTEAYEALL